MGFIFYINIRVLVLYSVQVLRYNTVPVPAATVTVLGFAVLCHSRYCTVSTVLMYVCNIELYSIAMQAYCTGINTAVLSKTKLRHGLYPKKINLSVNVNLKPYGTKPYS